MEIFTGIIVGMVLLGFICGVTTLIFYWAERSVYGPILSERTLDNLMSQIGELELNIYSQNILSGHNGTLNTFISTISSPRFAKWYISDFGRIPKSSKWTRYLDNKCTELQDKAMNDYAG